MIFLLFPAYTFDLCTRAVIFGSMGCCPQFVHKHFCSNYWRFVLNARDFICIKIYSAIKAWTFSLQIKAQEDIQCHWLLSVLVSLDTCLYDSAAFHFFTQRCDLFVFFIFQHRYWRFVASPIAATSSWIDYLCVCVSFCILKMAFGNENSIYISA